MNFSTNIYYFLKPAIPRPVRLALRRTRASVLRRQVSDRWPIDEGAGTVPHDWSGWPEHKRFAFVLTHDVEGRDGLNRCGPLAAMEEALGFRSAFNLVPEGEYQVPSSLRVDLSTRGFEVAVHDLHHDGTLYRSAASFAHQAARINDYLKGWGAVGFRSGFMFHNLTWLQQLDVLYDASTFDVDPFEPQPDGMSTIFPFWVARTDGTGFVELPYTLAQDSTLFLMLGEKTIDVWIQKLDWIVKRGGMALVNVHPDYMTFDGRATNVEYPSGLYAEFLQHVRSHYARDAWMALPREVAFYIKERRTRDQISTQSPEMMTSA